MPFRYADTTDLEKEPLDNRRKHGSLCTGFSFAFYSIIYRVQGELLALYIIKKASIQIKRTY